MTNKIILHIPHASTNIPIIDGYIVDTVVLDNEILKLTDWYTDDLFCSEQDEMIIAPFSRIFCDPERFTDDAMEVMAQHGMGVLYEKGDDGKTIRNITPELRDRILTSYYWKHHARLSAAVNEQLELFGEAIIIDGHSYPSRPLVRDLDQNPNRPDFNIGTDPYHTPKKLIDLSIAFFESAGYTLGIDWPYRGTIVPMEHYQKNKNVQSIMLEINRSLYLNEPGNEKSANYEEIKKITSQYIEAAKSLVG